MKENVPNNLEVGERIRSIRENLKMNREMFSEMYNEPESMYDNQKRDGTRANDMDLPIQSPSGIRR